jgi:hypothetical protein
MAREEISRRDDGSWLLRGDPPEPHAVAEAAEPVDGDSRSMRFERTVGV